MYDICIYEIPDIPGYPGIEQNEEGYPGIEQNVVGYPGIQQTEEGYPGIKQNVIGYPGITRCGGYVGITHVVPGNTSCSFFQRRKANSWYFIG